MSPVTTWRLRQTVGKGWVQDVIDGRPTITGDPQAARQWPSEEAALRVAERFPRGLVPVEAVEGPAFEPPRE